MKAIILAAGAGARMGQPKARLLIQGVPLALRHARRALEAGCEAVVVVTRRADVGWVEHDVRVRAAASDAPDQAGSLSIGVQALRKNVGDKDVGDGDLVLVTPVDALPARAETIALLAAALAGPAGLAGLAASPTFGGVGGHPVLVRWQVLTDAYLPGRTCPSLRDVLHGLGARRVRLEVADDAVTTNLDTPADVRALTGADPVFLPVRGL